jgi:hypothetical protein
MLGECAYRRFAWALGSRRVTDEHRSDRRQREVFPAVVTAGQNCSSRARYRAAPAT